MFAHSFTRVLLGAAIAIAASSLSFSTPALAQTQLNHSADLCNAYNSDGTLVRRTPGFVENSSATEDLHLVCPMVRVAGKSTTGIANVHVVDRSTTAGIRCSFYDLRAYAQSWYWSGWETSLGSGPNNNKTFSFASTSSEDQYSGFHHIYCILPPTDPTYGRSVIASYSSGE